MIIQLSSEESHSKDSCVEISKRKLFYYINKFLPREVLVLLSKGGKTIRNQQRIYQWVSV